MRWLFVLLMLACCGSPKKGIQFQIDLSEPIHRTVVIRNRCAFREFVGTGVIIGPRKIITAKHVLNCRWGKEISVANLNGTTYSVKKVYESPVSDYAVLSVEEDTKLREVSLGSFPLPGERVCFSAGFPTPRLSCGEVNSFRRVKQDDDMGITAIAEPGNSGSGIWNQRNELVGVIVFAVVCRHQFCASRGISAERFMLPVDK